MADSTLPGVLWLPNGNAFPGREGNTPRYVILHGTAGSTDEVNLGTFFKSTEGTGNPVASHYGIGIGGGIAQYIAERDGAWANGVVTAGHDPWWSETDSPNPNDITISIEHCKASADNSNPLTPAQQAASFALIADICTRHGIPMRPADTQGGITGHYSIDPVNRARCPGTYPWDALWAYLATNGEQDMPLPITDPFASTHFKETSATSWLCVTTGVVVGNAILDYYRFIQAAPRLPLTPELHGIIAGYPEYTMQFFEASYIAYDPRKIDNPGVPGGGLCYQGHLDRDNPAIRRFMAFAGIVAPALTATQIDTVTTAIKAASAGLLVALSDLEPTHP